MDTNSSPSILLLTLGYLNLIYYASILFCAPRFQHLSAWLIVEHILASLLLVLPLTIID